jgi:protein pelota
MGRLKSTNLKIFPTIMSEGGGKQYSGSQASGNSYFKEIYSQMEKSLHGDEEVIVVGPGESKRRLMNFLTTEHSQMRGKVHLVEGLDGTGHDGVLLAVRSPALRSKIHSSKLSSATEILHEAMRRIGTGDRRVAMTFPEASNAAVQRAVEKVLVSSNILTFNVDEQSLVDFLNTVESHGGLVYLLDGSTDVGIQVSTLKGVVALLRFPVS